MSAELIPLNKIAHNPYWCEWFVNKIIKEMEL